MGITAICIMNRKTVVLIVSLIAYCTDRNLPFAHAVKLPRLRSGKDGLGSSAVLDVSEPKSCWLYRDEFFPNRAFRDRVITDGGVCVRDSELWDGCERFGLNHTKFNVKCEICNVRSHSCCYGTSTDSALPEIFKAHALEEPPETCCVSKPTPPSTTPTPPSRTTPRTPHTVTPPSGTTETITLTPGTPTMTPNATTTPTPSTTSSTDTTTTSMTQTSTSTTPNHTTTSGTLTPPTRSSTTSRWPTTTPPTPNTTVTPPNPPTNTTMTPPPPPAPPCNTTSTTTSTPPNTTTTATPPPVTVPTGSTTPSLPPTTGTDTNPPPSRTSTPSIPSTTGTETYPPPSSTKTPPTESTTGTGTYPPPINTTTPPVPSTTGTGTYPPPSRTTTPSIPSTTGTLTYPPASSTTTPPTPSTTGTGTYPPPENTTTPSIPSTTGTLTYPPPSSTTTWPTPSTTGTGTYPPPSNTTTPSLPPTTGTGTYPSPSSTTTPSIPSTTGTGTYPPPIPTTTPSVSTTTGTVTYTPPTVTFTPNSTTWYTTTPTDVPPVSTPNITVKPCNDTPPNPPLPLFPSCGRSLDPTYNPAVGCFIVDIGHYISPSCDPDPLLDTFNSQGYSSRWRKTVGFPAGVIINATMVLTVSSGVLRDPKTRKAEPNLGVRVADSPMDPKAQYSAVKRIFFQDDDQLRTTNRYPDRLLVLLELEQPLNMQRACPVCFSDRRQDIPLSDASYYRDHAYTGKCELYGYIGWSWKDTQFLSYESVPQAPWDIRSCIDKHTELTQPLHARYLHGPSLTGFCAGGSTRSTGCMYGTGAPLMCRDNATATPRLVGLQVDAGCWTNEEYGTIVEDVIDTPTLGWIQMVTDGIAPSVPKRPCGDTG
ncbi:mucin-2-like [Paramacrobiotus metropolitanus]|uniref:mucin-2-like n=1 Tax=Paramacrobiotus metropolitanus TaxID=2943436 RepID=UPI0024455FFE|nr:mucin-2-like [Paramacrobiotus metropolitanus]